jgi:aminocarboxymuconate-semialdehyde decarboxylase
LTDTGIALEVVDHAVNELGLLGVNLPASIGDDPRIDAERLEPFYARVAALGVPLFLHPTDALFHDMLEGYKGALHLSLGRVMEVSVAASRLIFSGIMDRHPTLKVVMSHTGGALPYQSGRMDKNGRRAGLPHDPSVYVKRMYTDTVSPHSLGLKFAIDYYGIEHVLYGSDYPCWDPATAMRLLDELNLPAADQEKLFYGNAKRLLGLPGSVPARVSSAA